MKPWKPVKYTNADLSALQCVTAGIATEEQQRHAMKYIIETLGMTYDSVWFPDNRESDFASGRRFVGLSLVKMIKLKIGVLKDE